MNSKWFCISLIFLLAFSFSFPKRIIVVRDAGDYAPYEIKQADGSYAGIYLDTIRAVAKRLNIELVFKELPWKRCMLMVRTGEVDAIVTPFMNNKRRIFLYFAEEPVAYEKTVIFTYFNSGIKFSGNINELLEYKVGVVRGYSYGDKWDSTNFPNKFVSDDQESLLKVLAAKRVDVIVGTDYIVKYVARKIDVAHKIKVIGPPLSNDGGHIAFSKAKGISYKKLAKAFSKELKLFKKTEEYQEILTKYGAD